MLRQSSTLSRFFLKGYNNLIAVNYAQLDCRHTYSKRFKSRMSLAQRPKDAPFDRSQLEQLLNKRFFYIQSFQIYGGVRGFYDYGPPGSALQANILDYWRRHFILEEDMLELDTTVITPEEVFKTSGHVEKFSDWMVKDLKTPDIYRADHLVEAVIEARLEGHKKAIGQELAPKDEKEDAKKKKKAPKGSAPVVKLNDAEVKEYGNILATIDNFTGPQLGELIKKHKIINPETGNELTEPVEFNLMFSNQVGPTGHLKGYLRPETAQGHFVNFKKLLEFNNERMPFASAQIGRSFRNEISPRSGLLRVREFTMAEIEHYVDPQNKKHPRFPDVKDSKLRLLSRDIQLGGSTQPVEMSIGHAVAQGIVDNETLGYFLVRIYEFLVKIGINPERLRFRQHMANEMAHYATDCWDAEIQTSYGWIECVGCADRSAYDLTSHSVRTGEKLVVREALKEPKISEKYVPNIVRKLLGPKFKGAAKVIADTIESLDQERLECTKNELEKNGKTSIKAADGKTYELTPDLLTIEKKQIKETVREYIPNVVEPSFGIGRILYSLLEHSYWQRPGAEERGVLSFAPLVSPTKCLLVPLSSNEQFAPIIKDLSVKLRKLGVSSKGDDSGASIGKKYARNDELGTPFGITVDFQTLKDGTVTLRERDSTQQIREDSSTILQIVRELCNDEFTWDQVIKTYKIYDGEQNVD